MSKPRWTADSGHVARAKQRVRAVWFGMLFALVPSRVYEDAPHHSLGYVRHALLNARLAARWILHREDPSDVEFERTVNGQRRWLCMR